MEIKKSFSISEYVGVLLESRNKAHLFHWKTTGLAHAALGEYYETIVGQIDSLVETYQGKHGIFVIVSPSSKIAIGETAIKYFTDLSKTLEDKRNIFQDSYLQNQIDTILETVYKLLFKLKNENNKV